MEGGMQWKQVEENSSCRKLYIRKSHLINDINDFLYIFLLILTVVLRRRVAKSVVFSAL